MSDASEQTGDHPGRAIDRLCDTFESAWLAGTPMRLEDVVHNAPEGDRIDLFRELLHVEKALAVKSGSRFTTAMAHERLALLGPSSWQIGRYRVAGMLGQGGFGLVYLAHDGQLQRFVAIKVPHSDRVVTAADAETYLSEARTVANLDHPNIVPVYDVGSTDVYPCFIVTKFIEGSPLVDRIKNGRPACEEAAELVATIAEALHYAHHKGIVHRDIKPGNILLDSTGKPFVVDFGLALKEENLGRGPRYAGTPAYMSPEQARGEGHRVDGRSDIFSLGVVFYEMLVGQRPFKADTQDELLERIANFEPRPPRQHDDSIPKEVERICMKALSKRATDRYSTARDMADDLRHFLETPRRKAFEKDAPAIPLKQTGSLSSRLGSSGQRVSVVRSTFLFADFKGYTDRVRILEKTAGLQAAAEMRRKIAGYVDEAFRQLEGDILPDDYELIDTAGDGFFFHFQQAKNAFRFAEALQKITTTHNSQVTDELAEHWFRIGAATGEVAWDDGEPVGNVVNVGSRLQSASVGGDFVIDPATYNELPPEFQKLFGPQEVIRDKHDKPYEVHRTAFGRVVHPLPPVLAETPASDSRPIKIVPKGLRSFDAHDADFFLELLPGPRDRDGLPDSIRFWKTRIEEKDADNTFSVGLIYGPSGCGKSSLMKAGLLPRLSPAVIPMYVESTADETESRLLNGLRKRCPALHAQGTLKETLAALRQGQGVSAGKKVVIVLDQFEQWLHAKKEEPNTELVRALRQCDGGRLQVIVMVRDDFWMAATRFMRELEVRLVEDQNSAAVDLFPIRHAEKVLASFGRAFGVIPEKMDAATKDQRDFLTHAVAGLAQDGKVISVRLALFAEMMKGKSWTPATLRGVGGTEGVGVAFLEETFSANTAPPEHRYHQRAARGVLKALLPESGTDIKGHMRSYGELLEASGYAKRLKDFDDLVRLLDSEIRLITPTDPEGKEGADGEPSSQADPGQKYYQLTHDYLVPSLRDWLTRKQKETRRGRAELLLSDRAAVWNARPESRQLPSLRQWLGIRWLTVKKNWTQPQSRMMRKASRYHAVRMTTVGLLLAVATFTGLAIQDRIEEKQRVTREQSELKRKTTHAEGLVQAVLKADTAQVPSLVAELAPYRQWVDPLLRSENDKAVASSRQKLHTSLSLLPVDASQVEYLFDRLLNAEPETIGVIRDALADHRAKLDERLWVVLESSVPGKEQQQLCAAAALAAYAPEDRRWEGTSREVAEILAGVSPFFVKYWMEALDPVKGRLINPLCDIYRHGDRRGFDRLWVANILADYAADNPQVLADLLMDANEKQFAVIYPRFKERGEQGLPILGNEIDRKLPAELPSSDPKRETLAKRQANAAVALLRMNQADKVWKKLEHSPDPRVRSYIIHKLSPLGADARSLVKQLEVEKDITIRRALILSLGEFSEKEFSHDERQEVIPKLQALYRKEADAGLHAATEWLLRTWKQEAWLAMTNKEWRDTPEERERHLSRIHEALSKDREKTPPQWYVNGQGQTMVVIPGPAEFLMGSPSTEVGRSDYEPEHKKRIGRMFALSAKAVTVEQYRRFNKSYAFTERYAPTPDCPVVSMDWFQAAEYCNWLSKEEGIPEDQWSYEIENKTMKLRTNYLRLSGYRLPTEAEMEYATRAGAHTSRYFGETEDLLPKYAWYFKNSQERSWPVGSLKPNDFGLFDVQGNAYTWCQEAYQSYPKIMTDEASDDREDNLVISSTLSRVVRGGSFFVQASYVRSAFRNYDVPTYRNLYVGFRPSRTFIP